MLPGKKYTPADLWLVLRQRFWILVVPVALVVAGTAVYARTLPNRYLSDTLLLVVPQRVPESYVRSTVTTRIEDRLNAIAQNILSRTKLEQVINEFNLYPDARRTGMMEDVVEGMRTNDIKIEVLKGDAFKVTYVGNEPRTVMQVTEKLAGLFIEESVRDRAGQAESTNQFLDTQVEEARRRLAESEKRLEEYKRRFSGQLPSQSDANQQAIHYTQLQIEAVLQALARDRDEQEQTRRQLAELELTPDPAPLLPSVPENTAPQELTTARQLALVRENLARLELRLKPEHPDIQAQKLVIRDLERKAEAEALQAPVSAPPTPPAPVEIARERRLKEMRDRLQQLDRRIANGEKSEKELRVAVSGYRGRLDAVPTRESEMIELTRDYKSVSTQYESLVAKREESKISANLERRQQGEQFRLLDPARMPERPFSPNRRRLILIGLAAGLAIGLAFVALLEYRASSFSSDDEVAALLSLPVLAVVPLMESDRERRASFRRRVVIHAGYGALVSACLVIIFLATVR